MTLHAIQIQLKRNCIQIGVKSFESKLLTTVLKNNLSKRHNSKNTPFYSFLIGNQLLKRI
jgi:hypothetical protein